MKFIADSMLGRLARWLRLLGFDTSYSPHIEDTLILEIARDENRVLQEWGQVLFLAIKGDI